MEGQAGRGRGRARGRSQAQQMQQQPTRRPGVPEQPPPAARGAPPQQSVTAGRQAHRVADPPRPLGAAGVTQQLAQMAIGDNGNGDGNGAVAQTQGRGAWRGRGQRMEDRELEVLRPKHVEDKKGSSGTPCNLLANYFPVNKVTDWSLSQFRVDFIPDQESAFIRRVLVGEHKAKLGKYLFDGTILYTAEHHDQQFEFQSVRKSDNSPVILKFRLTAQLAPNSPMFMTISNLLIRQIMKTMKFEQMGRNYFNPEASISVTRHNLEIWPGYATAIRQHEEQILMVADLNFKMVRTQTVLDILYEIHDRNRADYQNEAVRELLGGIVLTRYNNKTYRIDDIAWNMNPLNTFPRRERGGAETQVSYKQYYKETYDITIRDDTQPLLLSRPRRRDIQRDRSEAEKLVYLVPEICVMTGIPDATRNNFNAMKDISAHTRVDPRGRVEQLHRFMRDMKQNNEVGKMMNSWGLSFAGDLLALRGRVLPVEKILLANRKSVTYDAKTADWSRDMRSEKLLRAMPLSNWIVVVTKRDEQNANNFLQALSRVCPPMGMNLMRPNVVTIDNDRTPTFIQAIQQNYSKTLDLVMCIVPNNRKDRYDAIKKLCCIDRPVPSQVIVGKNIMKQGALMSIATKVGIQINCKLGGAPWTVEIPVKDLMIAGYDSYHDSSKRGTSVGGMVFSTNETLSAYTSSVSFQTTHEEMVPQFRTAFHGALKRYFEINQRLPRRVIIYRDGVGEGQVFKVKDLELEQANQVIKEVCLQTGGQAPPQLSFIIVTKRISTRFFMKENGHVDNPLPGTVVDTGVTKPEWYDFFVVSQSVRQGTVAPTQYNIIHDESGFKPDHMQKLAYKLTHLYYNWQGTVRVPAPCAYAHKLAFLTGQSLHSHPNSTLADSLFYL